MLTVIIDYNNDRVEIDDMKFKVKEPSKFHEVIYELLNLINKEGTELKVIDEDRVKSIGEW